MSFEISYNLPPKVKKDTPVAFDIEMFHQDSEKLHTIHGDFACISVAIGDTVYMTFDEKKLPAVFKRIDKGLWIAHNALYDIRQLSKWVDFEEHFIWDTMLVDQNLWGGYYGSFSLDALSFRYLGQNMSKDVRKRFTNADRMTDDMIQYAAEDAYTTLQIYNKQKSCKIPYSYMGVDAPMIWTVLNMKPIKLDTDKWLRMGNSSLRLAGEIAKKFPDINMSSPIQVKRKLQGMVKWKIADTADGNMQEYIDKARHAGNAEAEKFIRAVLSYRELQKDGTTYGENWMTYTDNDFIYPAWRISEAITGRMACRSPNMTNVPSDPLRRECFIPPEGYVLGVADVAQQEPRVLAKLSQDKVLINYIKQGISVHVAVTREIFHNSQLGKKDPEYKTGKAVSLGLVYGLSSYGLARTLGIPKDEAAHYIDTYFRKFPGIKMYIDSYRRDASKHGYIQTILGRKTHINPYRWNWKNVAINAPIQGSAADQTKLACNIYRSMCDAKGLYFGLSIVVHDETVWYFPKEEEKEQIKTMTEAWHEAGKLTLGDKIPIALDLATGSDWSIK